MRLPAYPAYKDSGVEWIGQIPTHWQVTELRHLCDSISTGPFGTALGSDSYVSDGIPVVNPSHILNGTCVPDPDITVSQKTAEELANWRLASGDLVVARRGELGRAAIVSPEEAGWICGTGSLRVRPDQARSHVGYLFVVLQSVNAREWLALASVGSTMQNISEAIIGSLPVAVPSTPADQSAIAAFLDRETAKIDALVAEQERLMALLKEKRQAVISQAVTKGLDPNAKMKDSGVEWLGEIPEQWDVKKLKRIAAAITVGVVVNPTSYVTDEGVPFLYGSDVAEGKIDHSEARRVPPDVSRTVLSKTCLRAGDLVTVRVGAPGITAVVPPELEGANCASMMLMRGAPTFDSEWLCLVMNSAVGRYQVAVVQYGAAQEQFNIGHAVDFVVPVPTLAEQTTVATFVLSEVAKLDALGDEVESAIRLLKERRAALISAAVTGKIDVRGLVPQAQAAA